MSAPFAEEDAAGVRAAAQGGGDACGQAAPPGGAPLLWPMAGRGGSGKLDEFSGTGVGAGEDMMAIMSEASIGQVSWERMIRAVERVRERLARAAAALERAGIAYAIVGGNAVAAWVSRVDEA